MVTIKYSKVFERHFKARILPQKNLLAKYKERLKIFEKDRANPIINDHKLYGKPKGTRAFNIAGDVRVIYYEQGRNYFVFLDIGTHPQIYGMLLARILITTATLVD